MKGSTMKEMQPAPLPWGVLKLALALVAVTLLVLGVLVYREAVL